MIFGSKGGTMVGTMVVLLQKSDIIIMIYVKVVGTRNLAALRIHCNSGKTQFH